MSLQGADPRRIGVFGGAFDPPHAAHVLLARAAVDQLKLHRLHIIPTGFAWHKARTLTDAAHRLAMCELAFAQVPGAVVDPRETRRSGPTYTADTLAELQTEHPGAALFLVIGEDQAKALSTWHRADEVRKNAIICVAARPTSVEVAGVSKTKDLEIDGVRTLLMRPTSLSATEIRRIAARHQSLVPLVFDPVARYIEQHHLYQSA